MSAFEVVVQKCCAACGAGKPATEFNKARSCRDGLLSYCRDCNQAAGRRWGAANPERQRENNRRWRAANLEKVREDNRRWEAAHPPEYRAWQAMKQRCGNSRNTNYAWYGARGISVCARWRNSFANFQADMGPRPPGKTLDRIDVNGNYAPGNCRWATAAEQRANQRPATTP
jgi:hypothetical protein